MFTESIVFRIRALLKKNGMKMSFLETKLNKRAGYFSDCKAKNLNIPEEILKKTAILLDTSLEYLKGETDDPTFRLESLDMTVIPYESGEKYPVYGRTSAGLGVYATQDVLGYEEATMAYEKDRYFWLVVKGDSMAPQINNGDLVLVDRELPMESGTVGVIIVDDEDGFVKRTDIEEDTLWLHSFNPYYPPMSFDGEDIGRIRYVGRVVELKRKF